MASLPASPAPRAAALAVALAALAASSTDAREVKPEFGGRAELDLSDNQAPPPGKEAKPLAPKFDPALKPAFGCGGDEPLGQLPWIGEDDLEGARKSEAARIGGTEGMVARKGKRLVVTPTGGPPLAFTDWDQPGSKTAEGDTRYYWYAGTMQGSGYLRVEVHYGHDAPGSYLIQPGTGAFAYVHNGDKVGAVSGDGAHVATFDELNDPYRVVIATLEAKGPRIELECRFARPPEGVRAQTCGWLDAGRFELGWGREGEARVPYQFALRDKRWQVTVGAKTSPVEVHCWAYGKP